MKLLITPTLIPPTKKTAWAEITFSRISGSLDGTQKENFYTMESIITLSLPSF